MYNEKSKKNLKMFSSEYQPKKNGRPKGSLSITNEIIEVLQDIDITSSKPVKQLLARAAVKHAMKGNGAYFREIVNRIDGKITDKPEPTHKDKSPITFRVVYDDEFDPSE